MTNSSTTGGGGGCVVNCGGVVTPHAPICSLDSSKNIVFLGDSTSLSWTSTYANSAEINRGVGQISPFVASSSKAVFPVVSETSDITYTGTFSGLGGSTNCSTDLITVVADPPEIVEGSFKISNQKTGLKPKAEWQTEKVVNCDLATDTGWSQTKVCSGEGCASVSDFLVNKVILKETTYTLTCYHQLGYPVIATYRPLGYFVLSANPTEVEVDFAGGGDWSEPDVELGIVSWNGYNSPISFSADLSGLPESPGDETTNEAAFAPGTLTFTDYFTNGIKSLAQFFASYRFEGDKTAIVNGNSESVEITIGSKKTIPIYEPY